MPDANQLRVIMSESSPLVEELRARGVRMTPQRAIILQTIEQLPGHLTAEEIYATVQETSPYISLATVYRTLDLLNEMGLISETRMGKTTTHYALKAHATHHHAVCRICQRTYELPDDLFAPLVERLAREYGFVADVDHAVIHGWCAQCADS